MTPTNSISFFDSQFQRQIQEREFQLNPFELAALPHLRGRVLDYGCGLGNLALAAAQQDCSVVALDASHAAIVHLKQRAVAQALAIETAETDLRKYDIAENFDCVVCIGLLMFFDCTTARRVLAMLLSRVRPGGIAVINVLVEGTTYLDMFEADSYCLFPREEMAKHFAGWNVIQSEFSKFDAPGQRIKSFITLIAQKPQ